ncbi:MAG: glycosyltransferase family 2 protein [Oscillospiraceae bacterium]
MKKVLIMMATYNGEKYIRQQIESIIAQDYPEWHLIVQDDGSKDHTKEIVQEYCKKDSRIEWTVNDCGHHGVCYNFHALINKCKSLKGYDYFVFCDQDDIWYPNKLRTLMARFQNDEIPIMCYGDMYVIDGDGNRTADSFYGTFKRSMKNKYGIVFTNIIYGCNTMMNRKLFELVPPLDLEKEYVSYMMHDAFYARIATFCGKILYVKTPCMEYRRHGSNVSHNEESKTLATYFRLAFNLDELASFYARSFNQVLVSLKCIRKVGNQRAVAAAKYYEKVVRSSGVDAYLESRKYIDWGNYRREMGRFLVITSGLHKKYLLKPKEI